MAEDLERIEAELAHLTKALSDLKFNPPVTGRSSNVLSLSKDNEKTSCC